MHESILIIDDEPGITAALMTRFIVAGYEVNHAINGLAGIEAAQIHQPDAIVLDIRMPDIDGLEVCRRLKTIDRLENIPVIILSANLNNDTRQAASELGVHHAIAKPYEAREVLNAIKNALMIQYQ